VRVVGQVDDDLGVGAVFPLPVQNRRVRVYARVELAVTDLVRAAFDPGIEEGKRAPIFRAATSRGLDLGLVPARRGPRGVKASVVSWLVPASN